MTLREAQFSLRQIGMDGRSLVAITAGRVPQDMRDALAEPRATYIASHHPNVARRMVDMATLAAVATITDTMASARPVLEKALAYAKEHPTPPERWGRHVRHYAMEAWIRLFLDPGDPDVRNQAIRTAVGLSTPQSSNMVDLHTGVDLVTLNQLLAVLAVRAGQGPDAVRPLGQAILVESGLYRFADLALGTSIPWILLAAATPEVAERMDRRA